MTLPAMRRAVARLLTDAAFRDRFFGPSPPASDETGLTPEETAALRTLDPAKLGITSEGYAGKRIERVLSAFPRTLAALEALDPGARGRFLARTPFPPSEAAERETFLAYVRGGVAEPAARQRWVEDLAALERLAFEAPWPPGPPAYRLRRDVTRPIRSPWALARRANGPLADHLDPTRPPDAYPDAPRDVLVLRGAAGLALEDLGDGALLDACDGTRTVADLAARFGPAAEDAIGRWLKWRLVEDASSQR